MKIRNGFVSNSSSSSFILRKTAIPDVFSVAKLMLNAREQDYGKADDRPIELVKIDEAITLGIDPNIPVCFPTTNYDTYIYAQDSYIIIETCNNIHWYNYISSLEYLDDDYERDMNEPFWYLKEGVLGRVLTTEEYYRHIATLGLTKDDNFYNSCWTKTGHFGDIVKTLENEVVCVKCFEESLKKDMVLTSARRLRYRPVHIPRPTLKLR